MKMGWPTFSSSASFVVLTKRLEYVAFPSFSLTAWTCSGARHSTVQKATKLRTSDSYSTTYNSGFKKSAGYVGLRCKSKNKKTVTIWCHMFIFVCIFWGNMRCKAVRIV